MTQERPSKDTEKESAGRQDETLARLMKLAGPRSEVPLYIQDRVHTTVRSEWARATNISRMVRWSAPLAIAASIVVAVVIMVQQPDLRAQPVGTVSRLFGIAADAGMVPGDRVVAGDVMETLAGQGVSIELRYDVSLRIGANSRLRIDGSDEFTLLAGQVYIDSGDQIYRRQHVTIYTENGSARDIGTQFSVGFDGTEMSVAVREGKVDVKGASKAHTTRAGQKLRFRSGESASISDVLTTGPDWDWAISLAPAYDLESGSLMDFLKWVARETGKELVFTSDEVRMAAMRSRPHGSVADFAPMDALASVRRTSRNFNIQIGDHYISVSKQ